MPRRVLVARKRRRRLQPNAGGAVSELKRACAKRFGAYRVTAKRRAATSRLVSGRRSQRPVRIEHREAHRMRRNRPQHLSPRLARPRVPRRLATESLCRRRPAVRHPAWRRPTVEALSALDHATSTPVRADLAEIQLAPSTMQPTAATTATALRALRRLTRTAIVPDLCAVLPDRLRRCSCHAVLAALRSGPQAPVSLNASVPSAPISAIASAVSSGTNEATNSAIQSPAPSDLEGHRRRRLPTFALSLTATVIARFVPNATAGGPFDEAGGSELCEWDSEGRQAS